MNVWSFAYSLCVHMSFLWAPQFRPTSQESAIIVPRYEKNRLFNSENI